MTSYTPGPWDFSERSAPRMIKIKRKHWEVGQVSPPFFGCAVVFGDTDANSRLIRACPDLLEALVDLIGALDLAAHHDDIPVSLAGNDLIACARAAIAKATAE